MLDLLVRLLIAVGVVYCVRLLLPLLGLPSPFNEVALVIVAIVALLYVIKGPTWPNWPVSA